jgi:hypothetical protein
LITGMMFLPSVAREISTPLADSLFPLARVTRITFINY